MKTLFFMILYIQPCEVILGCKLYNQVKERMREKKREKGGRDESKEYWN